jgi:hypothetical protein
MASKKRYFLMFDMQYTIVVMVVGEEKSNKVMNLIVNP